MNALSLLLVIIAFVSLPTRSFAQTNLGMVGIRSVDGRFLQAHPDGELHANAENRNAEETWFLFEIDKAHHVYALLNWKNGKFLSKRVNGCALAVSTTVAPSEEWVLVNGKEFGVVNAVAFKNQADGSYLHVNKNGTRCGGEVSSSEKEGPPENNGSWPSWWVMEGAHEPGPGKDFWNKVGGTILGLPNKVDAADVSAVLASL